MNVSDLIDRYEAGGALLTTAVQGLTPGQVHVRAAPGVWSIAELVAHLVDSDLVGSDRMKRVIAEENPTLLAYDQDAWIARLGNAEVPVEEAAALFAANRRWTAVSLRKCAEADFGREGQHTENGPMTLARLLSGYVQHLDHHLRFLYAKRGNLGVSIYPRYSYPTD